MIDANIQEPDPQPIEDPKNGAADVMPKSIKDDGKRKELGLEIGQAHESGISQKGSLKDRVNKLEEMYQDRNIKPGNLPWPGANWFHWPLMSPRLDKRRASLVSSVMSPEFVYRFKRIGNQDPVEEVEQAIQWTIEAENFEQDLDQAVQCMMLSNSVMFRVTYQDHPDGLEKAVHTGPFSGPVTDVIRWDYACVFPAVPGPVKDKRLVSHCIGMRKAEVDAAIKRGEFFEDCRISGDDKSPRADKPLAGDLQDMETSAFSTEDDNVNIWDGIWKDDLDGEGEKWYRVIYHAETNTLLRIEPWPQEIPLPYVLMQIKKEYGVWWTESSPAFQLQALNIILNGIMNKFGWALDRITNASILVERAGGDGGDVTQIPPGSIIPVTKLGNTATIGGSGTLQGADWFVNSIVQFADSVSSVSGSVTGSPGQSSNPTATEENIKWAGFQLGTSSDVTAIASALLQMAKIRLALIAAHFERFKACYGDAISVEDEAVLRQPYVIEVSGKAPEDSPQMQLEKSQLLAQFAAAFPQGGIPIAPLMRMIVQNSGLENSEEIVRIMDEAEEQNAMLSPDMLMSLMQGVPQEGQLGSEQLSPEQLRELLAVVGGADDAAMAPEGEEPMLAGVGNY